MRSADGGDGRGRWRTLREGRGSLPIRLLERAGREWGVSTGTAAFIALLPAGIVLWTGISGLVGTEFFKVFTGEDRLYENLQFVLLLVSGALLLRTGLGLRRFGPRSIGVLYLAGAAFILFVAAEEISWGQWIFDWRTPPELAELNRQGEIGVHNLTGIETAFRVALFCVGAYGTLSGPILYCRRAAAVRDRTLGLLVPHWILAPYFAVPVLWRPLRAFGPRPEGYVFALQEFNEVEELIVYLGVFLFIAVQARRTAAALTGDPDAVAARGSA